MNTTQRIMILSAELGTNDKRANMRRTELLAEMLTQLNIETIEATGFYKGQMENSFFCIVRNNVEQFTLTEIALRNFEQESVLIQDGNGRAYLEFQNGSTQELGTLRAVSKEVAIQSDCYTEINNRYYLAS